MSNVENPPAGVKDVTRPESSNPVSRFECLETVGEIMDTSQIRLASYERFPREVMAIEDLTWTEKAVYCLLLGYSNRFKGRDEVRVYPAELTMAKELGMSERTVRRAIKALAKKRFIAIKRREKSNSNEYRFFKKPFLRDGFSEPFIRVRDRVTGSEMLLLRSELEPFQRWERENPGEAAKLISEASEVLAETEEHESEAPADITPPSPFAGMAPLASLPEPAERYLNESLSALRSSVRQAEVREAQILEGVEQ